MQCSKAKEIFSDYIDGSLSLQKTNELEEHLQECPDCESELEKLYKLRQVLKDAGQVEVSDEYWNNYWIRLKDKLPEKPIKVSFFTKFKYAFISLFRKPIPAIYTILAILLVSTAVYLSDLYIDRRSETAKTELHSELFDKSFAYREPSSTAGRSLSADMPTHEKIEEEKARIVTKPRESRGRASYGRGLAKKDELMAELKVEGQESEQQISERFKKEKSSFDSLDKKDASLNAPASKPESASKIANYRGIPLSHTLGDEEELMFREGVDTKKTDVKIYGFIIRVLQVKLPEDKKQISSLIINVDKANSLDSIFLEELNKANSQKGINFDFILSTKFVTPVNRETSVNFRNEDKNYNIKIIPSSNKDGLSYSIDYSQGAMSKAKNKVLNQVALPNLGETVMLKSTQPNNLPNKLLILLSRFQL